MEKINHKILNLINFVENRGNIEDGFKEENQRIEQMQKKLKEIKSSIDLINRKNEQLNLEIQRLQLARQKKSGDFSKLAAEGLDLSKKLVFYENKYDHQVLELDRLKNSISRLTEMQSGMNFPSENKLFLEVVKGLGVDLIEKNENVFVTVANKTSVMTLDIKDEIIPENVWNMLYD